MDFQKHYRLPMVHLMDTDLSLQLKHSRGGWPFLMVVAPNGVVLHKANNLVDREAKILELLQTLKATPETAPLQTLDGTDYSAETLRRSGEIDKPRIREWLSSTAAGSDGRVFVVWTSNRNGNDDVFLRTWDGAAWSADEPVAASEADEYDATVVVSPQNQAWFCWTSNAGGDRYDIFATSLDKLKAGEPPIRVTRSDDDAMHGRMACDADGGLWIAYYRWQKNQAGISRDKEVFARWLQDGSLSKEVHVSPSDVPSYEDHTDPAVAVVDGKAVVCWSWDYHRPKGYPPDAASPTIFASAIDEDLKASRPLLLSGRGIDMAPILTSVGKSAWCVWDTLARAGGRYEKTLFARRVDAESCQGEPMAVATGIEHICSPCIAVGPKEQAVLIWCQKQRGKDWEMRRADCTGLGRWSEAKPLVAEGNPRYCSATFDAAGVLWVSYTADTSQGRQIKTLRLG